MRERADQLVLEYLNRANNIAYRHLGSGERLDFMTRLRRRIEEYRAAAGGATEPEQVRRVLARFGDPEALVLRERRRIDASSPSRPAVGSAPDEVERRAPERPARPPRQRPEQWREPRRQWREPRLTRIRQPDRSLKPDRGADRSRIASPGPGDAAAGSDGAAKGKVRTKGKIRLNVLFRNQPVEVGAIGLLGIGGLLLPVPLWIFGAVTALLSRTWTTRDKWLGLLVPPLAAALVVVADADLGDLGNGLRSDDAPLPVRLAGPIGAVYLGWRLLRAVGTGPAGSRRRAGEGDQTEG